MFTTSICFKYLNTITTVLLPYIMSSCTYWQQVQRSTYIHICVNASDLHQICVPLNYIADIHIYYSACLVKDRPISQQFIKYIFWDVLYINLPDSSHSFIYFLNSGFQKTSDPFANGFSRCIGTICVNHRGNINYKCGNCVSIHR